MTDRELMQQALEILEFFWDSGYRNIAVKQKAAADALRERLAQTEQEFTPHEEGDDGWSDWVCPDPKSYLMKCCDCGLVHEAQFKVVRYKSEAEREDCEPVDDPNLQAVFRMRRSEQWSPKDTAYRPGGLAQPEQEPNKEGSPCPEFWDWLPKAYNFDGNGAFTKYNMEVAFLAGKQTSQPAQQEPVCAHGIGKTKCSFCHQPQPEQEPVITKDGEGMLLHGGWHSLPDGAKLYTTPPQRKPLTDEEIWQLVNDCSFNRDLHADKFARAIEAAHGITGEA